MSELQKLAKEISNKYPQLLEQIIGDPNFINNVIAAGEGMMGQADDENETLYGKFFEGEIKLTEDQKNEVNDIVEMGFPFDEVIQLYVAYGHNKELTVNALFDEQLNSDL